MLNVRKSKVIQCQFYKIYYIDILKCKNTQRTIFQTIDLCIFYLFIFLSIYLSLWFLADELESMNLE